MALKSINLALLAILLVVSSGISLADHSSKQKELDKLKSRIEKLRETIEVKEKSKSSSVLQLRRIEQKIGRLGGDIRKTNQALRDRKRSLKKLEQDKKAINRRIGEHSDQLSSQLYAAYTLGEQEQIKLLFSQQNTSQLQRNLTYYRYFNRNRLQLIEKARENHRQLVENENLIRQAQLDLERILKQQKTQKQTLTRDRSQRKKILASLEKELKQQGRDLSRLEQNAKHLSDLIESLSEILTDIPAEPPEHKSFSRLRGKLAWPVKGKVLNHFGKAKPPSNLRWQGVIIRAPVGNNVRAVSHGRIAFADWLRGMGNLIIIDHGDGYMSLYGHNQSLFKSTGEWVEAGEIIASIGNSGGQKNAGVYFEIRKKGRPQNPSTWCKAANWFAT